MTPEVKQVVLGALKFGYSHGLQRNLSSMPGIKSMNHNVTQIANIAMIVGQTTRYLQDICKKEGMPKKAEDFKFVYEKLLHSLR